eukprot:4386722-Alexandrium_andersonii.AAC.1
MKAGSGALMLLRCFTIRSALPTRRAAMSGDTPRPQLLVAPRSTGTDFKYLPIYTQPASEAAIWAIARHSFMG